MTFVCFSLEKRVIYMSAEREAIEDRFREMCKSSRKTNPWQPKSDADEQFLSDAVVVFCEEVIKNMDPQKPSEELSLLQLASEALALRLINIPGNCNWNTVLPFPFLPKSEKLINFKKIK